MSRGAAACFGEHPGEKERSGTRRKTSDIAHRRLSCYRRYPFALLAAGRRRRTGLLAVVLLEGLLLSRI